MRCPKSKRRGRTIVPHLAADEYHYFQGAAATMEMYPASDDHFFIPQGGRGDARFRRFYYKLLYIRVISFSDGNRKRDAADETAIGGIIDFRIGERIRVRLSALKTRYDKQVAVQSPYVLNGNGISAIGAHSDFVFDSFTMFGEIAGNSVDARSGVAGCIFRVSKRLSLSVQLRSYSANYVNPHAYGFGEQNGVVNGEIGRYMGMEYQASRKLKISTSYDEFSMPSFGALTNPAVNTSSVVNVPSQICKCVSSVQKYNQNRTEYVQLMPAMPRRKYSKNEIRKTCGHHVPLR